MADGRHLEKSKIGHISGTVQPIFTKFGTMNVQWFARFTPATLISLLQSHSQWLNFTDIYSLLPALLITTWSLFI